MPGFQHKNRKPATLSNKSPRPGIEILESRRMLSASQPVATPHLVISPLAASSALQGYTVSQIRHAYGFDQVSGSGAGQTIAIVDAYNDPNIAADLHTFDLKMGIADPPSLKVVSQTGGSVGSLKTDSGWAAEIALDVEWAHAIAPNAKIVLVEANSASISDLMTGVNTARNLAGVSVVSMSWGGSEFSGQTKYDSILTTPAGHQGVTFVAASGDSGSRWGVSWPSSSPNVLSVGGTTLFTTGAAGTYSTETGWSGSGGGISQVYSEPSYQIGAQSTGGRTNPDVSYNANPNTGFAVYDSIADGGIVGWQVIGGTSAGAPQWAALIAIANQTRASAGKASLDGATGTLPTLYKLYSAPGSASFSTYTAAFNDITQGRTSPFLAAHAGYDGVTGLGSPKVPQVVAALLGATTTSTTAAATTKATATTSAKRAAVASTTSVVENTASIPPAADRALSASSSPALAKNLIAESTTSSGLRLHPLASVPNVQGPSFATAALASFQHVTTSTLASPFIAATLSHPATTLIDSAMSVVPGGLQAGGQMSLAAFSDAMAAFAQESTSLGSLGAESPSHTRAWVATGAVLGIDAVLIASWVGSRRSAGRAKKPGQSRPAFSLRPIDY
jgi:subtilase family serine protease